MGPFPQCMDLPNTEEEPLLCRTSAGEDMPFSVGTFLNPHEFSKIVTFEGPGGQDIRTVDDSPQKKHVQKLGLQISLHDCLSVIQGLLPLRCS